MRGSSLFHLAVGLAKRKYFNAREIGGFAGKQLKFVLSGSEDLEDMASATEAALSFVQNRSVHELQDLVEQIFNAEMVDKLIPASLALAQGHLDAGQQVWLVTATPQELAAVIARRLGLTGALGTIAESRGGIYTGKLLGPPLHGLAKAEAVELHEGKRERRDGVAEVNRQKYDPQADGDRQSPDADSSAQPRAPVPPPRSVPSPDRPVDGDGPKNDPRQKTEVIYPSTVANT